MRKLVPKCGDAWACNFSVWRLEFVGSSVSLQLQQSPRGRTWVGSTCVISKSYGMQFLSGGSLGMGPWAWASVRVSFQYRKIELDFRTLVLVKYSVHNRLLNANTGRIGRTLARVSAGTGVVFSGAIKSPTPVGPQMQQPPSGGTWVGSTYNTLKSIFRTQVLPGEWLHISILDNRGTDHRGIFTRKHDRSCLEMSEADGVDSGAICKRGFIHLQFAEKPEAPEAERHLGSWILE
ncbi:hypothetical protein V1477_018797 [Vespula maculifrons]|uniref:Uncharacterized protein n=1 Tax=Vespula maculifrons TaxID=7453 RepID=A0ABD2AWE0_VESMC